mmetsp:Transcript_12219/g.21980  ORF Transcript_12219/g.21980 Transcript_12219/m.21980 type:complete len:654 (+) Transcript_12219:170-2131(+)
MILQERSGDVGMIMDSADDITCRNTKMRRLDECIERRGVALPRQVSADINEWDDQESGRFVSGSIMSDGDTKSEELSNEEFSDEEFSDEACSDDESTDYDDVEEELNEAMSLQTEQTDFNVTSIVVDFVSDDMSGQEAGRYIGENPRLKKLAIAGGSMEWNGESGTLEWFSKLCKGLAHNRSIGHMSLEECNLIEKAAISTITTLSPFFELNANLHRLEIVSCNLGDETIRMLASALSRRENKGSLQRIILDANGIGDESGSELVHTLNHGYDNLTHLSLGDNELGSKACIALGDLLSSPNTQLKSLDIENNQIDDGCITVLTNGLSSNTVLNELRLSFNCSITQAGWKTFSTCLQNPRSSLEILDLSSTNIADDGAIALGRGLMNNNTLTTLSCHDISANGMPIITSHGWRSIFGSLQNKGSALRMIDLRYSSIGEGGLLALTNALAGNSTVKMLDLSYNKQIPAAGWRSFFACLEHPNVALEEVSLRGNNVTDEEMTHLSRALRANNGTLESIDLGDNSSLTSVGWAHISRVLCDKSSAMAVYSSNHTLSSLGDQDDIPADLDDLLQLNQIGNKKDVSREKILRYHFQDGKTNIQELIDMNSNILHHAISWSCTNVTGHTLLYNFLRSLPSLVASVNIIANTSGAKRKRLS